VRQACRVDKSGRQGSAGYQAGRTEHAGRYESSHADRLAGREIRKGRRGRAGRQGRADQAGEVRQADIHESAEQAGMQGSSSWQTGREAISSVQGGCARQTRQERSGSQTFMKAESRQAGSSRQAGKSRQIRQDRAGTKGRSDQVRNQIGKQVRSGWEAEEAGRKVMQAGMAVQAVRADEAFRRQCNAGTHVGNQGRAGSQGRAGKQTGRQCRAGR
jgi:hypothetical protein